MEKGLSVPHREAPLSGSSINEISIEHANWEVLLYGGGYSQEMQNRSATGAAEEANFQASVVEDGYLDSSWAPILALIKAPSAVPEDENFTPDKLSKSTNKHFIPSLSSPNGINLTSPVLNTPSTTSMNATTIRNVKEAEKLAMFNSGPQKYHSEMQSNIAGSAFLNGYLASYQQQDDNRFTQIHHDQLPNIYRPRYNLSSSPQTEAETASGVTSSTQFAPATPEQARRLESLHSSLSTNVVGDQGLSQDTAKQKCRVPSADDEDTEQQCHRLIEHLVETSTTVIGTQLEERHDSDKGVSQEFDLNKTPPQKTPKRRKHRPKVVTEGRPRRGRKPINQKVDSNGEKLDKRKYVRTNVPKTTNTPEADAAKETKHKMSRPVSRSCRKKLNFEEKKTRGQSQCKPDCPSVGGNQRSRPHLVTADSEEIGPSSGFLNASINALLRPGQNEQVMSNKEAGIEHLRHQNIHPLQTERVTSADERTPTAQPLLSTETEKGNITTCSIMQRATAGIQRADYCCVGAHQHIQAGGDQFLHHRIQAGTNHSLCQKVQGGTGQPLYQERTTREKLLMQGMAQQLQQRTPHSSQGASKRDYSLTVEGDNASSVLLGCPILLNQEFQVHEHSNRGSLERDQNHKRRRVDSPCYTTIPSVHKVIRYTEDGLRQVETNASHIFVNQLEKGRGGAFSSSSINSCEKPNQNYMRGQPYMHSACAHRNVQRQDNLPEMSSIVEPMGDKRASKITTPLISLITARADSDVQCAPTSNRNRPCIDGQGTEAVYWTSPSIYSTKNKETESISKPLSKTPGSHELQKNPDSLNEIICRFQYLNLNHTDGEIIQHDEHAVIPYRGTGTMVPFEAFNPIKRRKPRPKVNLDPETSRKWNLLMGKEASNDDKDADKAKWWEEERKVFQGRADSFIARMHLVQGDRRFSRWKGSVVDSVIGVFLTQNVTDHLSSSAFMSLAARFPIKSTSKDITSRNDVPRIIVEEPEVITIDSDCEIGWHQKSSRPIYSRAPDESWDGRRCSPSLGNKASTFGEADTWRVEEVISSQDSTGSSTIEVAGKIHSCPGSHSRKYYATSGLETASNCSSTSFIHWELENIARCLDFIGQVPQSSLIDCLPKSGLGESRSMHEHMWSRNSINRPTSVYYPFDLNMPHTQAPIVHSNDYQFPLCDQSELSEVQSSLMLGNESIRFLSSNASTVSMGLHVDATSRGVGQGEPRKTANGRPWPQESPNGRDQAAYCQDSHSNHQHGGTAILQSVSKSDIEHSQRQIHEAQEVANVTNHGGWAYSNEKSMSVTGKEAHIENKSAEFISKEQLSSSTEAHSKAKIKMLKTKGAKIEIDKKMVFDWDGLRKQVYSNGIKRERTKDAMDSIDYEAVRSSDVNDISAAIKERGMNNMLADRIKAFLNRLVTDHGSIDLEWLKEVPPDKAKDYLLSIWGLGLKSVECVRLLTLHQHAFPVDTNVGRIAVRLGWVPLQPLPESLQLHLLELYPVLESIQKYLWPRLCTLDQRTLYELHYQLITFGKVFCTKSKPNCNACPLRGECRHFASAFTSARLALPGPEEKSIITSAVPVQPNQQPIINVNPVQLQLLEDKPPREEVFEQKRWEPIVEEPTTPEPEIIEQSEIDIEDAFYDDPDEIPTIKLSAEDITSLTNYIKENLEIQEGDMSKSLVALNPEAAYIPAPKLKNISRLRTEHQVYELPDTHPLLKELDKREPDDPSPYLLAIWTPGETANSIVPPEGTCSSKDSGKLCTENACFSCNNKRETNSQTVRGTILIPCRTAMRGSFPLNGTYFQVNEVFADHDSSLKPIDVPREFIWNLPRRTVYFGTTVSTIFKGMSTEEIQYCFWRGFVCVRGFDRLTRAPRPLMARLHFPASRWKGGRSTTNNKFNRGTTDNQ